MGSESTALCWLEVAEAVPLRFGDLAELIAERQFPRDTDRAALSREVAAENIEQRLKKLVASGALTVRSRHGMTRLDSPTGRQLQDAVLIPQLDMAPLRNEFGISIRFAQHGNGPTLWTIENAAAAIAEQEGWNDAARDTLRWQLLHAARNGVLTVRHPHTDLSYRPDTVRDWYELVTPTDVNAWLALDPGSSLRWEGTAPAVAEPAPAVAMAAARPLPDDGWRELAQAEARKIIKRQSARDLYPSQENIADEIAQDFRARVPPILGTGGKPLSGATIKRHALKGISSASKSAQSTALKQGK